MGNYIDKTGQRYGKLLAFERLVNYKNGTAYYKCLCDCGNETFVIAKNFGKTKSCGCYQIEKAKLSKTYKKKKGNEYIFEGNIAKIKLSNCDEFAIIDVDDYERTKHFTWLKDGYGYVCSRNLANVKPNTLKMHQLIKGRPKKPQILDHINRDKLDNRKENLRFTSNLVNSINRNKLSNNTSGYTGVEFRKNTKNYCASISVNGKLITSKYFDTIEKAIQARQELEQKYYGGIKWMQE